MDTDGSVSVLGVPELTGAGAINARRVDRLAFLGGFAANRVTEPGDVVFCTSPRPAAVVDVVGGSAVQYPARILRVDPVRGEGVSPHVLAHDINDRPAHSRAWRSWPVRRLPPDQLTAIGTAVESIATEQAAARARVDDLDTLRATLIQAVCSGSLTLDAAPDEPDPDRSPDDQQES